MCLYSSVFFARGLLVHIFFCHCHFNLNVSGIQPAYKFRLQLPAIVFWISNTAREFCREIEIEFEAK